MGRGRGKPALACLLGSLSLALPLAGCGADDHPNDPRPPQPIDVTVNIAEDGISVSPSAVGFGSENGQQPISQNQDVEQPPIDGNISQIIVFTVSNTTDFETRLEIGGGELKSSQPITPNGTGDYKVFLDTGEYLLSAADIPTATSARFSVGPDRISSQNDLLLP